MMTFSCQTVPPPDLAGWLQAQTQKHIQTIVSRPSLHREGRVQTFYKDRRVQTHEDEPNAVAAGLRISPRFHSTSIYENFQPLLRLYY